MKKHHREELRKRLPLLKTLVLADNDFSYTDENGKQVKVEGKDLIKKLRDCRKELKDSKEEFKEYKEHEQ